MAESPAHKFGQIIGDLLELALEPHLQKFARKHKLYLDKKGERNARSGKKVSWTDANGNKHDLDFVLERGGTENKIGTPVAFIESAWRRYTKHSRNKAQEIQSAILPLATKYKSSSPFVGVVLAGVFTEGALRQLKSLGFDVAKELLKLNRKGVDEFLGALSNSVSRFIERITILPLHGQENASNSVTEAIDFLEKYSEDKSKLPLSKYEIVIKYNTGDRIEASFKNKKDGIEFLAYYS